MATKAVKFDTGSTILKKESILSLETAAAILAKYPNFMIEIIGHTDAVGKAENNQILSEKRAKACLDNFILNGIDQNRLKFSGKGEAKPIADNNTIEGRKTNRRVEIILSQ